MLNPTPLTPDQAFALNAIRETSFWSHATPESATYLFKDLAPRRERRLATSLWQAMLHRNPNRIHLILGPRRVGKTTIMIQAIRHLIEDAAIRPSRVWLARGDHPDLMGKPLDTLVRAMMAASEATHEYPAFIFLDQVNHSADWDKWLKTFYDEHWPVRIAATINSTANASLNGTKSGMGRWIEHVVGPCSLPEVHYLGGGPDLERAPVTNLANALEEELAFTEITNHEDKAQKLVLSAGGFPELFLESTGELADPDLIAMRAIRILRDDVVMKVSYRDIPQAYKVTNPMRIERLLHILAGQNGGMVSPEKLSSSLGEVARATVDSYLSYLEQSLLVFMLSNYSGNEDSIQKRGRKLYFSDVSVGNAILSKPVALYGTPDERGRAWENIAMSHLYFAARANIIRLHYWRDAGGKNEVDAVYDDPQGPLAIELTVARRHHMRGLRALTNRHPEFEGRSWLVGSSDAPVSPSRSHDGIGRATTLMLLRACGRLSMAAQTSWYVNGA